MSQNSTLLLLPRELRDLIYDHILGTKGYMKSPATLKLTQQSDNQPIELALALTCRQLAVEIRDYAFRSTNIVTFTSLCTDGQRIAAGRWGHIFAEMCRVESQMLVLARGCLTPAIVEDVATYFPQFRRLLDDLMRGVPVEDFLLRGVWGEAPSLQVQVVLYTLQCMASHPNFSADASAAVKIDWTRIGEPKRVVSLDHAPWAIPSKEEMDSMCRALRIRERPPGIPGFGVWPREKYQYSATAEAIQFLGSMNPTVLQRLHRIVIVEDQLSVAHAQCHGQGLIELCHAYSHLRIERRVNLWRCILQSGFWAEQSLTESLDPFSRMWRIGHLPASRVANSIASWIVEAVALRHLGMPDESFSMVIDGSPSPQQSTQVFQIIERTALQQHLKDLKDRTSTHIERRRSNDYFYEYFPEMIDEIIKGRSVVKCDFEIGELWPEFGDRYEDWDNLEVIEGALEAYSLPKEFHLAAPLPSWQDLMLENSTSIPL